MKQLLLMSILLTGLSQAAIAEVTVEESGTKAIFLLNGRQISPVEATEAAKTSSKLQRCTPIKDALTGDGKPAYRCKFVKMVINPKTGTTKWSNI